jgi:electron transfer flavoprotein beta subunit
MKILVCITHVPDTTSRIAFINDHTKFDDNGVQYIIGPYDDYALARAVELKDELGASITALHVGGQAADPTIRKALAIGADNAIRVNIQPDDSYYVAQQIAAVARDNEYDLILMGRESIDFNGGQVHGMVGALLNIPSISPVMELIIEDGVAKMVREIEGGKEHVNIPLPLVAGCQEPIAEWKIPNMRGIMSARSKPLEVVEPVDSDSKTTTVKYQLPAAKGSVKMIDADQVEELVALLRNEAKVI